MEKKDFQGNWDSFTQKPERKHHYGCKLDKMSKTDYSVGICFSVDMWLREFYIYINLIKWTLCIGRFAELDGIEDDD